MSKELKFTQEVKDNWLKALKSGKYTQGFTKLISKKGEQYNISGKTEYCCIGILGKIHPDLRCHSEKSSKNPYQFLVNNFSSSVVSDLYKANDEIFFKEQMFLKEKNYPQDYSNIIPLIEKLKVSDGVLLQK